MKVYSAINRRERKKLDTRQKIVKIAIYLFRKNGYETTTMEQIAAEVDIAKGTLYNYFPVKEAIVCEYWNNTAGFKPRALELINLLPDTKSRLLKTLNRTIDHFSSNKEMFRIYLQYRLKSLYNNIGNRAKSGLEDVLSIIIKTGQSSGDIRKDVEAEVLIKHIEVMFLMVSLNWLEENGSASPETEMSRLVDIFLQGASSGTPKGRKPSSIKKIKAKSGDLLHLPL
jgi:AcrR family transcriptional regulator